MKKIVLVVIVAMLAGQVLQAQKITKIKANDLAEYIRKSDHPLVVNFWATWCAPCIKEIPYFQDEVKKYSAEKVELVLVSLDFADAYPNKLAAFIKKRNFDATFMWLNESNADYFCPLIEPKWTGSIPSTIFINNKTSYRSFFERQLTDRQFELEVKKLVEADKLKVKG